MLSDSSEFPGREFSRQILTGAWPGIDPTDLRLQGQQEAQAANEVREAADGSRRVADEFTQIGAGRFTDATHRGYMSDAALKDAKADFHDAYDKTLNSAADKVDSAKSRLEHIDWEAHDKISQLRQAGSSTAAFENAIVAAARTAALSHCDGGRSRNRGPGQGPGRPHATATRIRPNSGKRPPRKDVSRKSVYIDPQRRQRFRGR